MANFNEALGGIANGKITWQTFTIAELHYLDDYYASQTSGTHIFSVDDFDTIDVGRTKALELLGKGQDKEANAVYTNNLTDLLHARLEAKWFVDYQTVKVYWEAIPRPILSYAGASPVDSGNFSLENENNLVSDMTELLSGTGEQKIQAAKVIQGIAGTNLVTLVTLLRKLYKVTPGAGVSGTLLGNPGFLGVAGSAVTKQLSPKKDENNLLVFKNLGELSTRVDEAVFLQKLRDMNLFDAFQGVHTPGADVSDTLVKMVTRSNLLLTASSSTLYDPLLLEWLTQPLNSLGGNHLLSAEQRELLALDNLATFLDGTLTLGEPPATYSVRAPGAQHATQVLLSGLPAADVARAIGRLAREVLTSGTANPAIAAAILDTVYPPVSELIQELGQQPASANIRTLGALQKDRVDKRKLPPAPSVTDKQARANKAAAEYDRNYQNAQIGKGVIDVAAGFTTGGATNLKKVYVDEGLASADAALHKAIQGTPGLKHFDGAATLLTDPISQYAGNITAQAAKGVDNFTSNIAGEVLMGGMTGDFSGIGDLANNSFVKPFNAEFTKALDWMPFLPNDLKLAAEAGIKTQIGASKETDKNPRIGFAPVTASGPVQARDKLVLSSAFAQFLGVTQGSFTALEGISRSSGSVGNGAGATGRGLYGSNPRRIVAIDDFWLNNDMRYPGALPKPKFKLEGVKGGETFEFKLLPAVKTNLQVNRGGGDGQEMPFHQHGIKYKHVQNIVSIEVAGGGPVFQSLGVIGETIEMCGALISFGYRENFKTFNLGGFPYGAGGQMNDKGQQLKTTMSDHDLVKLNADERQAYHASNAYNQGELQLMNLVRSGKEYKLLVTYNLGGSKTLDVVNHTVMIHSVERIQQRRDKVFYKIVMMRTAFNGVMAKVENVTNSAEAAFANVLNTNAVNAGTTKEPAPVFQGFAAPPGATTEVNPTNNRRRFYITTSGVKKEVAGVPTPEAPGLFGELHPPIPGLQGGTPLVNGAKPNPSNPTGRPAAKGVPAKVAGTPAVLPAKPNDGKTVTPKAPAQAKQIVKPAAADATAGKQTINSAELEFPFSPLDWKQTGSGNWTATWLGNNYTIRGSAYAALLAAFKAAYPSGGQ